MKTKKMKKARIIPFGMLLFILLTLVTLLHVNTLPVFAAGAEESKLPQSVESLSKELFGDLKIKSSEYLYNLDDSADFIYIDYEDYGYAVFLASTLELLEYSPKGSLPFFDTMEKKYYSGPANYFNKSGEYFFDIISKEAIYISKDELQSLSKQSLEIFSSSKEQSNYDLPVNQSDKSGGLGDENHMPEDPVDLDPADFPGTAGTTYIPNHAYFTSDPTHGFNQTGTCAAVASQLLLSYNNYYNDRRIIADNFLNGSNTTLTERNKHPNFSENPLSMTSETLGSRGASEDGSDDPNSYFSQVVNAIPASSSASDAEYGIRNILNARNNQIEGTIDFTVNSHMALFGLGTVSVNDVRDIIKITKKDKVNFTN